MCWDSYCFPRLIFKSPSKWALTLFQAQQKCSSSQFSMRTYILNSSVPAHSTAWSLVRFNSTSAVPLQKEGLPGDLPWQEPFKSSFVSPKPLSDGAELPAVPKCAWQSDSASCSIPRSSSHQWGAWGLVQLHQTQHHTGSQARQRQPGVKSRETWTPSPNMSLNDQEKKS